jgi:hypothetical protein
MNSFTDSKDSDLYFFNYDPRAAVEYIADDSLDDVTLDQLDNALYARNILINHTLRGDL